MSSGELSYEQLRTLYAWIDAIPLTRPKRNICRDFSDGVMLAEVCAAYFPHLVELHNYPPANSTKQKIYNFETLNQRVLRKFGYVIPHHVIEDIVNCKQGAVENVLNTLQFKMAKYREKRESGVGSGGGGGGSNASPPTSARGLQQDSFAADHANNNSAISNVSNVRANNNNQNHQQQQQQPQKQHAAAGHGHVHGAAAKHPHHGGGGGGGNKSSVDSEILVEKEKQIRDLTATVEVLELKVAKLEQLVRLKDNKIQKLMHGK